MKTFNSIFTLLAVALFTAGCINEDPAYKNAPGPETPTDAKGELVLSNMGLRVIYDTQTDTSDEDTSGETTKPSSRAAQTQPASDDFIIEIFDAKDVSVIKMTYDELKVAFAEPYALEVGNYRMEIRSEETPPAVEWEHPVYGATKNFSILKAQATQIDEVVCTLQNIKVTLMCAVDLADKLTDDTSASVSLGNNKISFVKGETRAAYFMPTATVNTLNFKLEGKFADTQSPVFFSKTIPNVKAGQWRKITLVITYADKGDAKFDIKVENFIMDEEVVVDGTESLWEEIYEEEPEIDPSAPTITWDGHDITKPFQLKASMFNEQGNCTEPFRLDLVSPNGIEAFDVSISSTNADFLASLSAAQIPATFDLCKITPSHPAYTILAALGFPLGDEVKGQKNNSFDLADAMPLLYLRPGFDGTHTFSFKITDANGLHTPAALVLLVDRNNEGGTPTVIWQGHDIDQQYTLTKEMTIDIDITAPAGIKSLQVTIDSDLLTAELPGMGIPVPFDLCNVDEALGKLLSGEFGFPINDQVKNQTSISVSITPFVNLLIMFPGKNNFILDVTDNNGVTTTKTVQLHVE